MASLCALVTAGTALADVTPPGIPVGLDNYRLWDHWADQRIGVRAYMRSTYDRSGRNETADAAHFLYQERDDFNVTLDLAGPGVLYFIRTNHWHGSPWHYEVDGVDHVISESSTADPDHPTPQSTFIPPEIFPPPLAFTWSTTRGADLSWLPIGFEKSLRLAYGRTFYGTGYYIFDRYVEGTPLSQPVKAFDFKSPPSADAIEALKRAGDDLSSENASHEVAEVRLHRKQPMATLFDLRGPSMVRSFSIRIPRDKADALADARLRITWDDRGEPSVDAPLALFFGTGTLFNRANVTHLVKSLPMNVIFEGDSVLLRCQFPMPFFASAKIELVAADSEAIEGVTIDAEIRREPFTQSPASVGYFHATFHDHGTQPERGRDLVLLDTCGIEGADDWSGSFVGTSFIFTDRAALGTLEGDPRFFFDDALSPQAHGTGTEEWAGGGDYWGGLTMSLPLAGHPVGAPKVEAAKNDQDKNHSAYRFLLADLFPFGRNARIQLEHGAEDDSLEHYRTVTYWYGLPAASIVRTDLLTIGDPTSEKGHAYISPGASVPQRLRSRYELGVDSYRTPGAADSKERTVVIPETERQVRYTQGVSDFELTLRPDNRGVMLRRTLDYAVPNQRAQIFVADASDPAREPKWEPAGTWYTPGSTKWYHSFPKTETGASEPEMRTSNRRFREEELLLPLRLTTGRKAIRVRIVHEPIDRPLLPSMKAEKSAWSEIDYAAYCWITPEFVPPK